MLASLLLLYTVSFLGEQVSDTVFKISLHNYFVVFRRAADAAIRFQKLREVLQVAIVTEKSGDERDRFSGALFRIELDAERLLAWWNGRRWSRSVLVFEEVAVGGIDQTAVVFFRLAVHRAKDVGTLSNVVPRGAETAVKIST